MADLPSHEAPDYVSNEPLLRRQQAFGYTQEDLKFLLTPMAEAGEVDMHGPFTADQLADLVTSCELDDGRRVRL